MENTNDINGTKRIRLKLTDQLLTDRAKCFTDTHLFCAFLTSCCCEIHKVDAASINTNAPIIENIHINCIRPPAALPSLKSLYKAPFIHRE